jgi:putative methyltransferase (TIGR04325 family)
MQTEPNTIRSLLGRSGLHALELPMFRPLSEPFRRRLFRRPYGTENDYYGVYPTFAAAQAAANALSSRELPASYDNKAATRLYRDHMQRIRTSDYPLVFWLGRLIADGQRSIFDLGGHIGVSYYGFRKYLDYPADLGWTIHDLPSVMAAGKRWADEHDASGQLGFTDSPEHADGKDVLVSTGALQYLDYTLPELLQRLQRKPPHVLVNLTPMHPDRSFFTLQNLGIAICPYRVSSVIDFTRGMEGLGYRTVDHWQSFERRLHIPYAPDCAVDSYHGFHFELAA